MIKHFRFFLSAIVLAFLVSCDELMDDGRIKEGVIVYDVQYPKMDESSVLADLLPTKMEMHFKDNKFFNELSTGFGMFKMNVINDGDDHQMIQMVKLINERYAVQYDKEGALQSLENFPKMTIQETGKKKEIAGFMCNEANVTLHGDSAETYKIYFTKEIHLDNANWFTQYAGVEGVLMEYQVERYNLCTRFTAVDVLSQEIEDEIFEVPGEYENVDEDFMNAKMEEIFNSFSE